MNDDTAACARFRKQLSASRDSAGWLDSDTSTHVTTCTACRQWMVAADHACRLVKLRTPTGPSLVTGAVAAWDQRGGHRLHVRHRRGRGLLAVAAVGCLAVAALVATGDGVHSHLGTRAGRELVILEVAIAVGLTCAAWRPQRFLTGVVPVLVLVTTVNIALSLSDLIVGETVPLVELTHVPFGIGLTGAILCRVYVDIRPNEEHPAPALHMHP